VLRQGTDAPPVVLIDGRAQQVMAASDVVLAAGGTAILEAMLLKRPVVMAYKVTPMSYWLAGWLVKVDMFSLPNLLAGRRLIPEFIQDQVSGENLSRAVLEYLEKPEQAAALRETFTGLHHQLRRDADHSAARVVLGMLQGGAAARGA
jgi:lipid-A-disaccharide synthase